MKYVHRKITGAGFIYKFLTIPNYVLKFIKSLNSHSVWKRMTSIFASNIVGEDYSYCRTNNLRVKAYTSEQMLSGSFKEERRRRL